MTGNEMDFTAGEPNIDGFRLLRLAHGRWRTIDTATLTIRLPDAHRVLLVAMAVRRGPSLNKLMQELSVRALTEHDAELRFRMRAAWGDSVRGLTVLDDLDRRHAEAFIEK